MDEPATPIAELVVALATVKSHVNRVLSTLGVTSVGERVVLAYEAGLVRPPAPPVS